MGLFWGGAQPAGAARRAAKEPADDAERRILGGVEAPPRRQRGHVLSVLGDVEHRPERDLLRGRRGGPPYVGDLVAVDAPALTRPEADVVGMLEGRGRSDADQHERQAGVREADAIW